MEKRCEKNRDGVDDGGADYYRDGVNNDNYDRGGIV